MRYREKGAVCPVIAGTANHVLSCHYGNSESRSALPFRGQRVTFFHVIAGTADHVLSCHTLVCFLLLFYTLRKSPSIAKAWFMGPLPLPRSSMAARAPEM